MGNLREEHHFKDQGVDGRIIFKWVFKIWDGTAWTSGVPRGGGFGVFKPSPRNSEDIGGVLDRMSKKNWRLDFLLQFTVFSCGCNLLNKGFF